MYYFLSNLSFVDLCYSSVITPKMLVNFVSEKNTISYAGCMSQLCLFLVFVIAECYTQSGAGPSGRPLWNNPL